MGRSKPMYRKSSLLSAAERDRINTAAASKATMKQITIEQWANSFHSNIVGCSCCICKSCLYWWSGRCPYGGCYDDHRAKVMPYDVEHPGEIRNAWSNWQTEQAYWCRGGITFYATICEHYVRYVGSCVVEECFGSMIQKYQDGYIRCCLVDNVGCKKCYEDWRQRNEQIHKAG